MASATVHEAVLVVRADGTRLGADLSQARVTLQTGMTGLQSLVRTLAPVLSIAGLATFGRSVVDLGGRLTDLSEQTGIATQTLSGIKSTLEESGTSVESFATAIFQVQKNLGQIQNEADPAAQAVRYLGLNLDQLRNADTDRFLDLIVDSLGNIKNPMERAALGAALMGKNFKELVPAVTAMAGRMAELRASGMSAQDIAALDEAGDAWTRFGNTLEIATGRLLASASRNLQRTQGTAGRIHQLAARRCYARSVSKA